MAGKSKEDNRERTMGKAKGNAKEAYGALSGDEARKEEGGRAQQRKAAAQEETEKKDKANRQKEEANQAERKRDKQQGEDKGLLGGVGDILSGRDKRS